MKKRLKSTRNILKIHFETAVWCLLLVRLFMFQREGWMAGMTGASSNIGCLETLPVARCWTECPRSTRLGSVRLYTRGCIVYSVCSGVIQEPIYNSKYNGAIYSGVYKGAVSRASSIFCCFTQWATSLSLSWHMSLRLHFIYQRKREAPALSTFSPPTTTKILRLFLWSIDPWVTSCIKVSVKPSILTNNHN